ncbi:MAG TPA: FAD-binding oxidoreductase, partial [Acidimicrobiales bacterium]|nr:FAD-binding oxidoreductase [Acidimicrobiales bacterium]
MSGAAPADSTTATDALCGWGRTSPTAAAVSSPPDADALERLLKGAEPGVIARGLGRSYGDAAQSSGGIVVSTSALSSIGPVDRATATVEVGAGTSLHTLMTALIPQGWFVAVTPGTRYVSIGGAIAADIHGKNHHVSGSFARHVESLTLVTPVGTFEVGPDNDPELFWATAGGMGLTGVVTRARLRLLPVETSWIDVETTRFQRLDEVMAEMERNDASSPYSVAWVDCLSHRGSARPCVLTRGDHVRADALPPQLRDRRLAVPRPPRLGVPLAPPARLANRASVRLLNEAWFRASRPGRAMRTLSSFFHPLDGIGSWNLLYGRQGFVQYQFLVPSGRGDVVPRAID